MRDIIHASPHGNSESIEVQILALLDGVEWKLHQAKNFKNLPGDKIDNYLIIFDIIIRQSSVHTVHTVHTIHTVHTVQRVHTVHTSQLNTTFPIGCFFSFHRTVSVSKASESFNPCTFTSGQLATKKKIV